MCISLEMLDAAFKMHGVMEVDNLKNHSLQDLALRK